MWQRRSAYRFSVEAVSLVPLGREHVRERERVPGLRHHAAIDLRLQTADIERHEEHVAPGIGHRLVAVQELLRGEDLFDRVRGLVRIGVHVVVERNLAALEQIDEIAGRLAREQLAGDDGPGRAAGEKAGVADDDAPSDVGQTLEDRRRHQAANAAADEREDGENRLIGIHRRLLVNEEIPPRQGRSFIVGNVHRLRVKSRSAEGLNSKQCRSERCCRGESMNKKNRFHPGALEAKRPATISSHRIAAIRGPISRAADEGKPKAPSSESLLPDMRARAWARLSGSEFHEACPPQTCASHLLPSAQPAVCIWQPENNALPVADLQPGCSITT